MSSKLFLVSYDLNRPRGEDAYPDLIGALKRDGAVKVLYSEWLVWSSDSSREIATRYLAYVDNNDSMLVCAVSEPAWYNVMNGPKAGPMLNAA